MNIREIQINQENYIRINNIHIFIQANADMVPIIEEIAKKRNQRIHIFELYPTAISNLISMICSEVQDDTKVIIHVPYMVKDFGRVLGSGIPRDCGRWSIVSERKEVNFKYVDHGSKTFTIRFDRDKDGFHIRTYLESSTFTLPKSSYVISDELRVFMTVAQMNHPELFKNEIIKQFKESTPKGILEGFSDDEDIWGYIMDEWNSWHHEEECKDE